MGAHLEFASTSGGATDLGYTASTAGIGAGTAPLYDGQFDLPTEFVAGLNPPQEVTP